MKKIFKKIDVRGVQKAHCKELREVYMDVYISCDIYTQRTVFPVSEADQFLCIRENVLVINYKPVFTGYTSFIFNCDSRVKKKDFQCSACIVWGTIKRRG